MPPPTPVSALCPTLIGRVVQLTALTDLITSVGAIQSSGGSGHKDESPQPTRARVALIAGEAGIGKSRLVAEAKAVAAQHNMLVLQGRCFEPDRTFPYAPITDLLHTFCIARSAAELAQTFALVAPELIKIFPELSTFLPSLAPTPALEPEQEKRRIFQALGQWLQAIGMHGVGAHGRAPQLLIIEDLHWCDDLSLEFVLQWARREAMQPRLLLLTYRNDERHPALTAFLANLDRARLATEFALPRLNLDEVAIMLRAIFKPSTPLRPDFVEAVFTLTEGNPFFIEEILKELVATQEIFHAQISWTRKPIRELQMPRTVQSAVQRRLVQLSPAARALLEAAAVAGRRFDFTVLQTITQHDEQRLLSLMKELLDAQLVSEESAEAFVFRHALTQQAIYNSLLVRERQALHRQIAEALEKQTGPTAQPDMHSATLAQHYAEGGVWDKTFYWAQRAGEQAQRLHAPRAAIEHFTRAIEAMQNLTPPQIQPQGAPAQPVDVAAIKLYRARAQDYELLGAFEASRADYDHALQIAEQTRERMSVCQGLLDLGWLWTNRSYERAGEYFQLALTAARETGDAATLAQTLNRVGNWHLHAERPQDALRHHQEALSIFQLRNDSAAMATTLDLMGVTAFMGGDVWAGAKYYQQAIVLFQQLRDPIGLINSRSTSMMRGGMYLLDTVCTLPIPFEEITQCENEVLKLAREMGWRAGETSTLMYLAMALGKRGEFARALRYAQEGLQVAQEIEQRVWLASLYNTLGHLHSDMLALPTARTHFEQAYRWARESGSQHLVHKAGGDLAIALLRGAELSAAATLLSEFDARLPMRNTGQRSVWAARAELLLAQQRPQSALRLLDQLIASAAHVEEGGVIPRLWLIRAETLKQMNRLDDAANLLQAAIDTTRTQGHLPLFWRLHASLAHVHQKQRRRQPAETAIAAARTIIAELAAKIPAELRDPFVRQAEATLPSLAAPTPQRARKQAFGGLTTREREVAMLIAQGQSNKAIAETLVLSERTIEKHIQNMMAKLGVDSRTQIAVWAAGKGLGVKG